MGQGLPVSLHHLDSADGNQGARARVKRGECRGRWLKMFSVRAGLWPWEVMGAEKGREKRG